jgi:GNAT superfamily N-acetyltransferase
MDIAQRLEANYFAYIRSMALEHGVEEGLEWVYTGVGLQNRVFNATLKPKSLDAQILSAMQRFARWDVPMNWDLSTSSLPDHLGHELERFGFNHRLSLAGMALELPHLQPQPHRPELFILPVDRTNLGVWAKVVGMANAYPKTRIGLFQMVYERTLDQPQWQHFLVGLGQEILGACSLFEAEGVLGLYWLATLPRARRQGLASAALSSLLQAQQGQHRWAVLQSPAPSLGLFGRLGFIEVGKIEVYQVKPV